jgi:hypothetical protein
VLLLPAACAPQPENDDFVSASQLSELVTGRTLYVEPENDDFVSRQLSELVTCRSGRCCSSSSSIILLYLAPDGSGWVDSQVIPGAFPQPGEMSKILDWRVAGPSQVCIWAAPLIGELASFVGPHRICVEAFRSHGKAEGLRAVVTQDGVSRSGMVRLYPFNAFPPFLVDQYLELVRAHYGGTIPIWPIP